MFTVILPWVGTSHGSEGPVHALSFWAFLFYLFKFLFSLYIYMYLYHWPVKLFSIQATNPTESSFNLNNILLQTRLQSIYLLCCFLFVSLFLFSFPPFFFLFSPLFLLFLLTASFLFFLLFKLLLFFTLFLFPI